MTNSIELMTERFSRLPDDAQKAIALFKYDDALKSLHVKHKLHIDQAAALEDDVADVIFGDKKSTELISSLAEDLHTDEGTARSIAIDVNETILLPIQELMKQAVEENDPALSR